MSEKKSKGTSEALIKDVKRVQKLFPDVTLTRDFFRTHSKYTQAVMTTYFPSFNDLLEAAGLVKHEEEKKELSPEQKLELEKAKLTAKTEGKKLQLDQALVQIEDLQAQLNAVLNLTDKTPQLYDIEPKVSKGQSESVAFMIASDWHSEELVLEGQVGGLNKHNLTIGSERATNFWKGGHRLWDIFRKDTAIKTIVVGLLGDFITGRIHEDTSESCILAPADSIFRVQNMLLSGLNFLLANTPEDTEIIVVCHGGNHGRMTQHQLIANETGNSLEQYMFYNMRTHYEGIKRIRFQIADGYHSFIRLFDGNYKIRFHHGHQINYGGGVGGITIPVNKAIAQWNKGNKVDLDVFGHFHQYINFGNFICNGSLIGYNAYALSIKADYERPQQAFFLVNKKWNAKTISTPIFV
jgi:hypothetical protein